MRKVIIICIFLILFLVGCTSLPFNVAICGNEICEAEEEKLCLSDCTAASATAVSLTDTTDVTDTASEDSRTADSSATDSTSGATDSTTDNTTGTSSTDSSSSENSDDDDDNDDDDDEIIYETQEGVACEHAWDCTAWEACEENGMQTRICYYTGTCSVEQGQPDTRQLCTYIAPEEESVVIEEEKESCSDELQNQGERGIDCGGPCSACPTPIPVAEQPAPTLPYILLGIGLLLLIAGVILAHKYKNNIKRYWETVKMKFGKKTIKPLAPLQPPPKFPNQQQFSTNPQYPRYR